MNGHRLPSYTTNSVYETLKCIKTTDPRFLWISKEFGEEPDRDIDVATIIDEQFADEVDGDKRRSAMLHHLGNMLEDMRSLNPAEELFDISSPSFTNPRLFSTMLRRMGWSGDSWYTEFQASLALNMSIPGVRYERAKFVRGLRRGPVWAPALYRSAALVQEMAPISETQFRVVCGIEPEGPESMTLWGFLTALDLLEIDHWFRVERMMGEHVLHCEMKVDFGYPHDFLEEQAEHANIKIEREARRYRKERRRERAERERYVDPWEVHAPRRSRITDVGIRDHVSVQWGDIPRNSELRKSPGYDDLRYGGRLITSRNLILPELELPFESEESETNSQLVVEDDAPSLAQHLEAFAEYASDSESTQQAEAVLIPEEDLAEIEALVLSETELTLENDEAEAEETPHMTVEDGPPSLMQHLEAFAEQVTDTESAPQSEAVIVPEEDFGAFEALNPVPADSSDLVDVSEFMRDDLLGHYTGAIDGSVLDQLGEIGMPYVPIIDREADKCIGAVPILRMRNKLNAGLPEIHVDDKKMTGVEISRYIDPNDLASLLVQHRVVFYNESEEDWGLILREDVLNSVGR